MCDVANHFRFSFIIHYAILSYYWLKIKLLIFTEKIFESGSIKILL